MKLKLRVYRDYWGYYYVQRRTWLGKWVNLTRNDGYPIAFDYLNGAESTALRMPHRGYVGFAEDEAYAELRGRNQEDM